MRAVRQRGTKPELALRTALDELNIKYIIDQSPLPELRSRPDLLFPDARIAVYVDGCFWHGCPTHGTMPKANREWWQAKLEANRLRDVNATDLLVGAGWQVIRIWEHVDPVEAANSLAHLLDQSKMNQDSMVEN